MHIAPAKVRLFFCSCKCFVAFLFLRSEIEVMSEHCWCRRLTLLKWDFNSIEVTFQKHRNDAVNTMFSLDENYVFTRWKHSIHDVKVPLSRSTSLGAGFSAGFSVGFSVGNFSVTCWLSVASAGNAGNASFFVLYLIYNKRLHARGWGAAFWYRLQKGKYPFRVIVLQQPLHLLLPMYQIW